MSHVHFLLFRSLGVQEFRSLGVPLNSSFAASEPSEHLNLFITPRSCPSIV